MTLLQSSYLVSLWGCEETEDSSKSNGICKRTNVFDGNPPYILPFKINVIKCWCSNRATNSTWVAAPVPRVYVHERKRNSSETGLVVRLAQRPQLQHNSESARPPRNIRPRMEQRHLLRLHSRPLRTHVPSPARGSGHSPPQLAPRCNLFGSATCW